MRTRTESPLKDPMLLLVLLAMVLGVIGIASPAHALTYPIVETGQETCYNATAPIACPASGAAFYGQPRQITSTAFSYHDNGDGTVSDLVTGLMWQKAPSPRIGWAVALPEPE